MTTIKSSRNHLRNLRIATAAVVVAGVFGLGGAGTPPVRNVFKQWTETRVGPLVFFAVLEGLYRDGIANSDVDLIIPPGENGKPKFDQEHFVYACPLCHPAFEAFRLYRQRDNIFGFKAPTNTLGSGLDQAIRTRLRSLNADERRQAIQELISRWVSQRLEMMRLTLAEREAITREMEQARKQGMGELKRAARPGQAGQSRTNCPICDGSFGACRLRPH